MFYYVLLQDLKLERDNKGRERLAYRKEGWKFCTFEGHRTHYLQAGGCHAAQSTLFRVMFAWLLALTIFQKVFLAPRTLAHCAVGSRANIASCPGNCGWLLTLVYLCIAGSEGPPVVLIHGFGASGYHWYIRVAVCVLCL